MHDRCAHEKPMIEERISPRRLLMGMGGLIPTSICGQVAGVMPRGA